MPRKQRFKPSRKPKPPVVEGFPQDQVPHPSTQDSVSSQPTRQTGNHSTITE